MVTPMLWLAIVLGLAGLVALGIAFAIPARSRGRTPVAFLTRLTALPEYVRARRRMLMASLAGLAVIALTAVFALAGVARPTTMETISPKRHLRDVMLCLDVSGSMIGFDAEIMESYIEMVDSFDGERIGMTIFNATAVTVFPLTDDYDMAKEFLEEAHEGFSSYGTDGLDFITPTQPENVPGSSLIGDGVVNCVEAFDRKDEERSRSMILATDNELAGEPLFSLTEATEHAVENEVRIYALAPSRYFFPLNLEELEQAAETTDGEFHSMSDSGAVDRIVTSVQETEARLTDGRLVTLFHDKPVVPLVGSGLGLLALLLLAWRMRL
ncbi:MAG TPA: VWA domain-containing protein [Brevibacterium sp.]|nr:VWA domain-containing protein [Brevibacterium sp.]